MLPYVMDVGSRTFSLRIDGRNQQAHVDENFCERGLVYSILYLHHVMHPGVCFCGMASPAFIDILCTGSPNMQIPLEHNKPHGIA